MRKTVRVWLWDRDKYIQILKQGVGEGEEEAERYCCKYCCLSFFFFKVGLPWGPWALKQQKRCWHLPLATSPACISAGIAHLRSGCGTSRLWLGLPPARCGTVRRALCGTSERKERMMRSPNERLQGPGGQEEHAWGVAFGADRGYWGLCGGTDV